MDTMADKLIALVLAVACLICLAMFVSLVGMLVPALMAPAMANAIGFWSLYALLMFMLASPVLITLGMLFD